MNVTQAGFTTKARTWLLLAALTALFVGIGAAIGGGFLWFFVVFSVLMNVAAYWGSDKFAILASRAKPVSEAEAPDQMTMSDEADVRRAAAGARTEALTDSPPAGARRRPMSRTAPGGRRQGPLAG